MDIVISLLNLLIGALVQLLAVTQLQGAIK
jgi:hypothetical protein